MSGVLLVAAAWLLLGSSPVLAQQGAISGTVTEEATGQPVSGAQVFVVGTNMGTVTNDDGAYRIEGVPAGQHDVQVQTLGYSTVTRSVTVEAGSITTVDFQLTVSAVQLDEVSVNVITGQQERRRTIGSNTSVINTDQVSSGAVNSFQDLLQGRATGVNLESTAGTSGVGQRLRIRGSGSLSLGNRPLIFIDGIRVQGSPDGLQAGGTGGQSISLLSMLNPQNIESVEILKGPSATAQYGSAASNGVILISTHQGTGGPGGAQWHAYVETGSIHDMTEYPTNVMAFENNTGMSNPSYFIKYNDGGLTPDGVSENVRPGLQTCTNWMAAAGTCTQDLVFQHNSLRDPRSSPFQRGTRYKAGLSVSSALGGGSSYYISGAWEDEENVLTNNHLAKFNTVGNSNFQIQDDLTVNLRAQYIHQDLTLPNNDNSIFSPLINGLMAAPAYMPGDGGGAFTTGQYRGTQGASWAHYGFFFTPDELADITSRTSSDRFIVGADGTYRPFDWLSLRGNVGGDLNFRDDGQIVQQGEAIIGGLYSVGFRDRATGHQNTWTANASARASFALTEDIQSTTIVGGAFDQEDAHFTECTGGGLIPGIPSCSGTTQLFSVSESFTKIRTLAGFVTQDVAINDRLYLSASVRADDNSAFGGNIGMEFYPSGSVSWVLSDTPFFPDTDGTLSTVRVRGAFGFSGNRPGFRDARSLFSPISVTRNGENLRAVTVSETGNPDLQPERVREIEGGIDFGFFDDRVNLDVTYYDRASTDALIARSLPPSVGLTGSVFENLGKITNTGFEIGLDGTAIRTEDAQVAFNAAFTTNNNEIVELGEGVEPIFFDPQAHIEGFPAGAFHQQKLEYSDANGDGLLALDEVSTSTDTAVFIDESQPTWTLSFGSNVQLFGFLTLSGQAEARGGHSQLNFTESFRCGEGFTSSIRPTGCPAIGDPNASLERQSRFIGSFDKGTSVGWIQDATFLKIREVSATVRPPSAVVEAAPWTDGMRLSLSGRNVAMFTGYDGIDPELNFTGAGANFGQAEFNTQPPPTVLTVRVDYRF